MVTLLSHVAPRLPLLGPVIGWTRPAPHDPGFLLARIWVRFNNHESDTPLLLMTQLWDRGSCTPRPATAALWKITVVYPSQADPKLWLHFGIADVKVPVKGDCFVRVVALHRCVAAGNCFLRAGELQRAPAPIELGGLGAASWQSVLAADPAGTPAGECCIGDLLFKVADLVHGWPEPEQIDLGRLLKQDGSDESADAELDRFAQSAYASLRASQAWITGEVQAPGLSLRSRQRRQVRAIDECNASIAPAAQASMDATGTSLAFAAGCCRYPGTLFERDRADKSIESMAALAWDTAGPAFAIFSGDQIYADATAGVFEVQDRSEKISARYESAYATPSFRKLASRIPLYMTADDHEIEDGWSLPRARASHWQRFEVDRNRRLEHWARLLYLAYQRMHGPPPSGAGAANWFEFEVAGVRFFLMDTRFERGVGPTGRPPPLCSDEQMTALVAWLGREPLSTPKFIVSGSVFAPGLCSEADVPTDQSRSDTWQGFAAERTRLARAIVAAGADNVVFLSGDYHCAAVATIEWTDCVPRRHPLRAYSIVSPPLYAPFPFANTRGRDVLLEETIIDAAATAESDKVLAHCRARPFDGAGFAVITVERKNPGHHSILVEFLDPFAAGGIDGAASRVAVRLADGELEVLSMPTGS